MEILIVDRSGRGHAFVELVSRSGEEAVVHYAPGVGTIAAPRVISHPEWSLDDPGPMVELARNRAVDLVMVTHTGALVAGFVDAFRAAGLPVVGPDRAATRLESSKVWAKNLFARYGIPSPEHATFSDPVAAKAHVRDIGHPVVVKADGLCGGNGVFVCDDEKQARTAIDRLMIERVFGAAGDRVVIERRLSGQELSFFALLDGESYSILPMALDYPKSDDGNRGVSSGGMGAISPHPLESGELVATIEKALLHPLMRLVTEEEMVYTGPIYLGCMMVEDEPYLLEVNVRMGDPEAEVVLPRIKNDFIALGRAMHDGSLCSHRLELDPRFFCDVVATQGPTTHGGRRYPGWPYGEFSRGHPITGLEALDTEECRLYVGEAVARGSELVSDGGRVVHVVGVGETLEHASDNAHRNIAKIHFEGIRYRRDIGVVMPWENTPQVVFGGAP